MVVGGGEFLKGMGVCVRDIIRRGMEGGLK